MGRLDHPTVCKMFGTFKTAESLYMVLEPLIGGELYSYMRDQVDALPWPPKPLRPKPAPPKPAPAGPPPQTRAGRAPPQTRAGPAPPQTHAGRPPAQTRAGWSSVRRALSPSGSCASVKLTGG